MKLVWDRKKRKWVEEEEYSNKLRIKEALHELLEEIEFEVEIDPKTGKGRIKLKK